MAKVKSKKKAKTLQGICKKYPGVSIAADLYSEVGGTPWIPSRSMVLNWMCGGGIPYGKVMEIFGQESSGKSLVALDFLVMAQKLGGFGMWVDAEQSFSKDWWTANGVDLTKVVIYNETAVEKISDWISEMAPVLRSELIHNEPILLVVDSIAALDTVTRLSSDQLDAKAEMGARAKAIGDMLRKRNQQLSALGVSCIFINQLRKKLGTSIFEDPETTTGGEAMKFFAHLRLGFYRKKQIKAKVNRQEAWVGNYVSLRMKKNKVAPPKPTMETEIYFLEEYGQLGFSRYAGLVNVLERAGAIKREKGSSIYYDPDGNKIARGEEALNKLLEENKSIRQKLVDFAKINTFSKTKKLLANLRESGTNLYPVIEEGKEEEDE